jgi:hypothetical protein
MKLWWIRSKSSLLSLVILWVCAETVRGFVQSPTFQLRAIVLLSSSLSNSTDTVLPPRSKERRTRIPRTNSIYRKSQWDGVALKPINILKLSDVLKKVNINKERRESERMHRIRSTTGKAWKASYSTSIKTQRRIQDAAISKGIAKTDLQRATLVLKTLLETPPHKCNAANLVCALTLSAKLIGNKPTSDATLDLLYQVTDIIIEKEVLPDMSIRQLCNTVWAIAKFYERNKKVLPTKHNAISSSAGESELWDLRQPIQKSPAERLDETIDAVAAQLTELLLSKDSGALAKEGELCMACWAYGILRPRRKPPGWNYEPQIGELAVHSTQENTLDGSSVNTADTIKFETWSRAVIDECSELEPSRASDKLFDAIATTFVESSQAGHNETLNLTQNGRIRSCRWNELANLAWAFATHGSSCSAQSQTLLLAIAQEASSRLQSSDGQTIASRDVAQIVWAIGTLLSDNFRLADDYLELICSVRNYTGVQNVNIRARPFRDWSCTDIVQVVSSLAHARLDEPDLLRVLYEEATERLSICDKASLETLHRPFWMWEVSILLWAQARLYLKSPQGEIFAGFPYKAVEYLNKGALDAKSLAEICIGDQELSNIAWALTVLQSYDSLIVSQLLSQCFDAAAAACKKEGVIYLEHAHQLWQALYLLEEECPEAVANVPQWFHDSLRDKWMLEKARSKISSARHRSLSQTLKLMGVPHINEHVEDIDVAIVLKPHAMWTHESALDSDNFGDKSVKVAVEFDGPNHFTRQGAKNPTKPRTLGHTVLKYRLLRKQGWHVVRVPFYEYDKIPFWASMERQRYLQRLLKTHGNLKFSDADFSEYKPPTTSKKSRFD